MSFGDVKPVNSEFMYYGSDDFDTGSEEHRRRLTAHLSRQRSSLWLKWKRLSTDIHISHIGKKPIFMTCPNCLEPTETKITWVVTKKTKRAACLFTMVLCCCIPLCTTTWKIAKHYCGHCEAFVGLGE